MIKYLSANSDLKELIRDGIIIVDFYADWCGPCQMMAPVLEELSNHEIIKVNIDEFREVTGEYGVMSVPTLIFYKDKEEVRRELGFKSKEELENIIKELS